MSHDQSLVIDHLSKRYAIPVIHDLTLEVAGGELLCVLGPNGCGKTTLLRMAAGFDVPDNGEVLVDGEPAPPGGPPWALCSRSRACCPGSRSATTCA
ncbi:MAG TPA: ATP-binding cassette domain-containing protein [Chloroflexota bacterium]|jgi:ABC-type Fe3+/spermidine/putrescine transport system ATPase subunit